MIASRLNYTLEEITNHPVSWIKKVSDVLYKQDLENKLHNMGLHGVSGKEIERIRSDFNRQLSGEKRDIFVPLEDLQAMGIKAGRPNKTTVVRGHKK